MVDKKSSIIRDRDRELLLPISITPNNEQLSPKPSSSTPSFSLHANRETFSKVLRSWASKKFMTGCVILLPLAITFYVTWWFISFVDGFFSPIYDQLGINIFGLGFITSVTFIFVVGIFMSSWLGASVLSLGEWFIKRMPFVRHIYDASKQISTAISPDQNSRAFKEVVIIKHPRASEFAFGFITSSFVLQKSSYQGACRCHKFLPHLTQASTDMDLEITQVENYVNILGFNLFVLALDDKMLGETFEAVLDKFQVHS
ncbi:hypothetical protein E3N88_40838 [Mikania micrantha]|uniref:Uncharacterized protein n=1 Tax=Mikania micrantha TaxID=192012 RepID=A0A5N6LPR6_9ASTR|nr:hypothetical protein E3N88_40838 [Mikania micrantha]